MSPAPPAPSSVRADAWITAVRLVKTRTLAAAACAGGHVTVNGARARPSTPVRIGDVVAVRGDDRLRVARVITLIKKRVGAAVAATCYQDESPPPPPKEEADHARRERGAGRPTKRDRREIDRLRGR